MAAVEGYGYDKAALKNYMAGMYAWPGFDAASSYAYSNATSRALAAVPQASISKEGGEAALGSSPQAGASPPFAFSPAGQHQAVVPNTNTATALPTPNAAFSNHASQSTTALSSLQLPQQRMTPGSTPKKKPMPVPMHLKDESYWERRRRNNESARRSRETRRIKEDQTHYKLLYLENENLQLRTEISMMRAELDRMRLLLGNAQLQSQQQSFAATNAVQ